MHIVGLSKCYPIGRILHPRNSLWVKNCTYYTQVRCAATTTPANKSPITSATAINTSYDCEKNIQAAATTTQNLVIDSRPKQYAKLAKIRLTGFVTSTVIAGGFLASQSFVGSVPVIATAALGTFLCSSSAAALNQLLETPYDSQMRRTAIRPLVIGQVSPLETVIFALVTGISGVTILYNLVNGLTAALGAANLILYSFVYTPMKRSNVANTWIGSIVGAVPPLMGSSAVSGHISIDSAVLALILFSWQFPHFNALSWNLRHEYARAGYRMMSVVNPELCKRVALRHSGLLLAYSCALPVCGSTSSLFTLLALPFNLQFIRLSWKFQKQADSASSRKLFRFSLLYLPAVLGILVMTQPRGRPSSPESVKEGLGASEKVRDTYEIEARYSQ